MMKIYLKNSNECLIYKKNVVIFLTFILFFFLLPNAHVLADTPQKNILAQMKEDLRAIPEGTPPFASLIERWSHQYGTKAIEPLHTLLKDQSLSDQIRYIALMALVRTSGPSSIPKVESLLSDPSWQIKVGALRALRMIHKAHPEDTKLLLSKSPSPYIKLLSDKALVVRNEAIITIDTLNIPGLKNALLEALHSPKNYHGGRPLWVPQKILSHLSKHEPSRELTQEILPLLKNNSDPEFLELTLMTLEKISPKRPTLSEQASLKEKLTAWNNVQF